MAGNNIAIVIWDRQIKGPLLYYPDNMGNKTKAFFTSKQLAEDAVSNLVEKEGRLREDLIISKITGLEPL